MGAPGTGKTRTLLNIGQYFSEVLKRKVYGIDLEDKLEVTAVGEYGTVPSWLNLSVCVEGKHSQWEQLKKVSVDIINIAQPGDCILFDRVDLSWVAVRRWFAFQKFGKDLADRMLDSTKALGTKASMFTPEFDQGVWNAIDEQ